MKKTIVMLLVSLLSCNEVKVKTNKVPAFSFKTYPAIWVERDSSRKVGFLSIQVTPRIKADSSDNTASLKADTLVGYTVTIPIVDSLKKPVLDSAGKPKTTIRQYIVGNYPDTIKWLDHLDIDSILKIKGKF